MPVPPVRRPSSAPPRHAIGKPNLAVPVYYIVKLRDGRPGVVAAADHTAVWVPRRDPHLPLRHDVFWWDRLLLALAPKAGFVLYSDDHDTKALNSQDQYVRRGYVYDAIDMTWLKRAMDMSMDAWTTPKLKTRETEKLIDWLLRLSKNAGATFSKGKDTYAAAEVVKEQLLAHPEVKAVVYSQHKATPAQRDSVLGLPLPPNASSAGGGYERRKIGGGLFDSAYVESFYRGREKVGEVVARPHR